LSAESPGSRSKEVLKGMCVRRFVREREKLLNSARMRAMEEAEEEATACWNHTVVLPRTGDEVEEMGSTSQTKSCIAEGKAAAQTCTEMVSYEGCNALASLPAIQARRKSIELNSSGFEISDNLNFDTLKFLLSTGRGDIKGRLPALFEQASAIGAHTALLGPGHPVCRDIIPYSPWLEGVPTTYTSELDMENHLHAACDDDDRIQVLDSQVHYPTDPVATERKRSSSPYSMEAAMEID